MYTRFYNSIISPKNIVEFRNDSLVKVFLYILFFALLLSTRVAIETVTFDGLTPALKESIMDEAHIIDESCVISNAILECDVEENQLLLETTFINYYIDSSEDISSSEYGSTYNIVFNDDKLLLVMSNTVVHEMLISDLPFAFENIDFSLQTSDPDVFYNELFEGIDDFFMSQKATWGTIMVLFDFVSNFIMFMLFVVISAWMLRLRFKQVKFRQLFTMTVYSSTALYLILILNSLYSLSFFIVLLLIIAAFRQNSQLSIELYKRLHKKNDKPE